MNFEIDITKSNYEQTLQVFNSLEQICNNRVLLVINNFDERYLVDSKFASYDSYCDIYEVHNLCSRLLLLNATILVDGSFNIDSFYKKEHYRHFHELLYLLAEMCYHNRNYELASDYIKKAISIIQYCSSTYWAEYTKKDSKLLNIIQIDYGLSAGYGADLDEIEIDTFLEEFDDCIDD